MIKEKISGCEEVAVVFTSVIGYSHQKVNLPCSL